MHYLIHIENQIQLHQPRILAMFIGDFKSWLIALDFLSNKTKAKLKLIRISTFTHTYSPIYANKVLLKLPPLKMIQLRRIHLASSRKCCVHVYMPAFARWNDSVTILKMCREREGPPLVGRARGQKYSSQLELLRKTAIIDHYFVEHLYFVAETRGSSHLVQSWHIHEIVHKVKVHSLEPPP